MHVYALLYAELVVLVQTVLAKDTVSKAADDKGICRTDTSFLLLQEIRRVQR